MRYLNIDKLIVETPYEFFKLLLHKQPLSSHQHYENEQHNADYDHEAFLGEEAKTFDQLSPEESKERLGYVCKVCVADRMFLCSLLDVVGKLWTK